MFKKNNNFLFQQLPQIDNVRLKKQYKDQYPMNKSSKNKLASQKENCSKHSSYSNNVFKGNRQEQHIITFQTDDYNQLQIVLSKQVQIMNENIDILRQKNHLKNKQIQTLANNINKMTQKSQALQAKITQKQKKLSKITTKYQELCEQTTVQQQKLAKQKLIFNEQLQKCAILNENMVLVQNKLQQSFKQAEFYRKKTSIFEQAEQQNNNLKDYLISLKEEQKLIQQEDINQQKQCSQLAQKLKALKNVYSQRSKINQRNITKLNQIQTEVANLTRAKQTLSKKQHDIKYLEMSMGDLNQELLFFNQEISELDFKMRKKQKTIKQLKNKLNERKNQKSYLTYNAIEENETPKESYRVVQSEQEQPFQKIAPKSIKTSKHHSSSAKKAKVETKNNSPFIIKTNITPTFTPHQQDKAQSQVQDAQSLQSSDAFKNIQKLINRFEQIKTKQKYKH